MRALWVIGASDTNLGRAVVDLAKRTQTDADEGGRYAKVYDTDVQKADVTFPVHIDAYVQKLRDFGVRDLDIAYCAGINRLDDIYRIDEMDMYQTFDVNVMGFIRVLRSVLRVYGSKPGLSVVAVASDAARNPMRNSIAYCASKAALVQAVRVAAREMAPLARVNAVSPAIIDDTPMTWAIDAEVRKQRGWSDEEAREYECSLIPMGRRAEKSEVARVILQTLAGPDFLTGANIEITGGK